MKHINLSSSWKFSCDPFNAYRCSLIFGRNKRDQAFLPVKGVLPNSHLLVENPYGGENSLLYEGDDQAAALKAAEKLCDIYALDHERAPQYVRNTTPLLPEGKFRVIKTREKGTLLVVDGEDTTDRVLLMVGCCGGFRGGVSLIETDAPAKILVQCSASSACDSSCEIIALMEDGQSVAFHSYGRRTNAVELYTLQGGEVIHQSYSKAEWDQRGASSEPADVL